MKRLFLVTGFLLLFASEIARVYFIMPFPGSQQTNTIDVAYWLNNNIFWIRILALVLLIYPLSVIFTKEKRWLKILSVSLLFLYSVVFFFFNYRFEADTMFYQPRNKQFADATHSNISKNKLILGVMINGEAKAYPIQLIGYHHQVRDTVGGQPVIITYCTVCRTGRAFQPFVNGKNETFRLVGMDHFNAMFEDAATKSWWRQATGEAIAGPLKGKSLQEIPSQQMTLESWLQMHPSSTILQPDTTFKDEYKSLADYDNGTIKGSLEHRDSASWKFKSWVIGVKENGFAKAYDWNELVKNKMIQDSLPSMPLLVTIEKDTATFHVFNRRVNNVILQFEKRDSNALTDTNTNSVWTMNGLCVDGKLKGVQMAALQAYQEFWHSWRTFHPNTLLYK